MDWFTGWAGPTGTKSDPAPSQTGAAGGCWWAMRQASCSGPGQWKHYTVVIQARQLIAFQGVSQNCVLKDQPTTFPFNLEGLAVRS